MLFTNLAESGSCVLELRVSALGINDWEWELETVGVSSAILLILSYDGFWIFGINSEKDVNWETFVIAEWRVSYKVDCIVLLFDVDCSSILSQIIETNERIFNWMNIFVFSFKNIDNLFKNNTAFDFSLSFFIGETCPCSSDSK